MLLHPEEMSKVSDTTLPGEQSLPLIHIRGADFAGTALTMIRTKEGSRFILWRSNYSILCLVACIDVVLGRLMRHWKMTLNGRLLLQQNEKVWRPPVFCQCSLFSVLGIHASTVAFV